jgi:hypothetical protein
MSTAPLCCGNKRHEFDFENRRQGPVLVGVPVDYRDNHRLVEIEVLN